MLSLCSRKLVWPTQVLETLPYQHYDNSKVMVACCEIMVGYLPVPVGPLNLNSNHMYVPVAITEHHQRLWQGVECSQW